MSGRLVYLLIIIYSIYNVLYFDLFKDKTQRRKGQR